MPKSRLTRIPKAAIILALVGALLIGGALVYGLRGKPAPKGDSLTAEQLEWIDGVAEGAVYKNQYDIWTTTTGKNVNDSRSYPEVRCAGKFYPEHPVAMKGCLTAVKGRPPNGYQYP